MIEAETETMDGAGAREGEGSESEDDGGSIRLNPFVQPPILKALFEQLPAKDLNEFLSAKRSNATFNFDGKIMVSTQDGGSGSRRAASFAELFELWDPADLDSYPFREFNLQRWNFKAGDIEQELLMALVGAHATSVTFEWCSFVGRDHFRRIIYQDLPKLQFLKMECCKVDNTYSWRNGPKEELLAYKEPAFGVHGLKSLEMFAGSPHSMMDMLSHFHKLESLHMDSGIPTYHNLLETIRLIREQDQTKLPLKNFDVDFTFELGSGGVFGNRERTSASIELLKLHERLNLPLQRLKISFGHKQLLESELNRNFNNENFIRDILQSHSSTLSSLKFVSENGYVGAVDTRAEVKCQPFPFGFNFENLVELVLPPTLSDNLNYLRYTPNLRLLQFTGVCLSMSESDNLFSNSSQLEIGDWTLPALTDLRLNIPLSIGNLKKLMKWMPNVEILRNTELDDVKLSMVCKYWKNLTALNDWGDEITDEGVVGVGNVHDADEGDEDGERGPNITKLKHLTIFVTRSSNLTSISVREGFLKLANLNEVRLGRSTKIGDEAKAALARRKIRCKP